MGGKEEEQMNGDTSKKPLIIRENLSLKESTNVAQQLENNGKIFKSNKNEHLAGKYYTVTFT